MAAIKELAEEAFEASERVKALGMMNAPTDYDERKKAFVALAQAQEAEAKALGTLEGAIKATQLIALLDMRDRHLALLLTVARVLRAKIKNEIYAEQADDLHALNEALAPFDGDTDSVANEAEPR